MNFGSFFLAEISRTMSSFRPGGAASASTSVMKPYLYSCWTSPSIVSVAVLILSQLNHFTHLIRLTLLTLLGGARRASPMNCNVIPFRPIASRQREPGLCRQINVKHTIASIAIKVAVLPHIRAKPGRTPLQGHLSRHPALHQGIQAIIDCRHRNLRHVPLRPYKHLFRRRVIAFAQQHSIDMLPLRGKTKTAPREPFAQPAIAFYVCRSIHLTLKLTRLPRLSIFGTILIPGPPAGTVHRRLPSRCAPGVIRLKYK